LLGGNAGPRIWVKLDRVLYKIRMGSDMKKYHVALSFAGEDRTYVDRVATTTAHGRLMLTILAGLAEFERELIRARTGEGRERAKARGVKQGSSSSPRTSSGKHGRAAPVVRPLRK